MANYYQDLRTPCGGKQTIGTLAGCFGHYRTSEISKSTYTNLTKVTDYSSGSTNIHGIDPYERPIRYRIEDCFGSPDCGTDILGNGLPGCDFPPSKSLNTASHALYVTQGKFVNSFQTASSIINFADCAKVGYKSINAKKAWFGRFGYTSEMWLMPDSVTYDCKCSTTNEHSQSDEVKFLGNVGHASATFTADAGSETPTVTTFTLDMSSNVARYSGNRTATCVTASNEETASQGLINLCYDAISFGNNNIGAIGGQFCFTQLESHFPSGIIEHYGYPHIVTQISATAYNLYWSQSYTVCDNEECSEFHDEVADYVSVDIDWQHYFRMQVYEPYYFGVVVDFALEYSNQSWFLDYMGKDGSPFLFYSTTEVHAYGSLNTQYTSNDVYADIKHLLSQWDMADDVKYPWNESVPTFWASPMLTYSEREVVVEPTLGICDLDGDEWKYTSDIYGKPHPYTGASYWNPQHKVLEPCFFVDSGYAEKGYGAWSGNDGIPKAATQWTNIEDARHYPQGAFLLFNPTTQVLYSNKWAESFVPKESFNYARPCGLDRWRLSGSAYCISSEDDKTITLEEQGSEATSIDGRLCRVWGMENPDLDGIWIVSGDDSYTHHLDTLIVSGSHLDLDFPTYLNDSPSPMISALHYQTLTAFNSMCGRAYISNVTGSPVTISLATPEYGLIKDDLIQVFDVVGADSIKNKHLYIDAKISNTEFVLRGTHDSGQEYISNIVVVDDGFAKASVVLLGQMPNLIEEGNQEWDMKPGLLNLSKWLIT